MGIKPEQPPSNFSDCDEEVYCKEHDFQEFLKLKKAERVKNRKVASVPRERFDFENCVTQLEENPTPENDELVDVLFK